MLDGKILRETGGNIPCRPLGIFKVKCERRVRKYFRNFSTVEVRRGVRLEHKDYSSYYKRLKLSEDVEESREGKE